MRGSWRPTTGPRRPLVSGRLTEMLSILKAMITREAARMRKVKFWGFFAVLFCFVCREVVTDLRSHGSTHASDLSEHTRVIHSLLNTVTLAALTDRGSDARSCQTKCLRVSCALCLSSTSTDAAFLLFTIIGAFFSASLPT